MVHKKPPVELAENQTKKFASGTLTREALLKKTKRIDVVVRDSRGRVYINTIGNDAYTGAEVEAAADALE